MPMLTNAEMNKLPAVVNILDALSSGLMKSPRLDKINLTTEVSARIANGSAKVSQFDRLYSSTNGLQSSFLLVTSYSASFSVMFDDLKACKISSQLVQVFSSLKYLLSMKSLIVKP